MYDLGVLGDKFDKVTSITLEELNKHVSNFYQSLYKVKDFQICKIVPLTYSQSKRLYLMVINDQHERLYIQFETKESPEPTMKEVESKGLQADLILRERPTCVWQIFGHQKLCDENMIELRLLGQEIEGNFFNSHNYALMYQQSYVQSPEFDYSPLTGLSYTDGSMIYTLSKNTPVYEMFKEQGLEGRKQSINENFSMLQLITEHKSLGSRVP